MTLGNVGEFLPFLFPNSKGLMAFLAGYFDESERPEGTEPICVAGVVFSPARYQRFVSSWQRNVLKFSDRQFTAFHMTDLVQGREEYKGLTISDRVLILDAAIDAVIKNANAGIGVHFEKAEFERKAPALWSEVFGSIYTVACGMCLQITGDWLTRWHNHMGVLYVFEKGHKFRAQADEFLTTFGQDEEFRKQTHYRNHIFELKGEPGLQAGDLLAWTVTRVTSVVDQKTIPPGLKPFAPSIRRFTNSMGDKYKVAQFAGANLDLFFEEIRHRQFKIFQRRGNYPKGLR